LGATSLPLLEIMCFFSARSSALCAFSNSSKFSTGAVQYRVLPLGRRGRRRPTRYLGAFLEQRCEEASALPRRGRQPDIGHCHRRIALACWLAELASRSRLCRGVFQLFSSSAQLIYPTLSPTSYGGFRCTAMNLVGRAINLSDCFNGPIGRHGTSLHSR